MSVIDISTRLQEQQILDEQKRSMLEILDHMRKDVDEGKIVEFVATSLDQNGYPQIHVAAMDLPSSVGLYEIGKHLLISGDAVDV